MNSRYKNKKRRCNKTMKLRGGSSPSEIPVNDNIMNVANQIIGLIDSSDADKVHKLNKVYQLSKIILPIEVPKGRVVVAETRPVNPSNNISGNVAEAIPINSLINNGPLLANANVKGVPNNNNNKSYPKVKEVPLSNVNLLKNLGAETDHSSIQQLYKDTTETLSQYLIKMPNSKEFENDFERFKTFIESKNIDVDEIKNNHPNLWSIYNIFLYLNNIFKKKDSNSEDMKKIMNNIITDDKTKYASILETTYFI